MMGSPVQPHPAVPVASTAVITIVVRRIRINLQPSSKPAATKFIAQTRRTLLTRESDRRSAADRVSLDDAAGLVSRLQSELARVIIGQERVVREVFVCLLAGGHCLLRGVPGL